MAVNGVKMLRWQNSWLIRIVNLGQTNFGLKFLFFAVLEIDETKADYNFILLLNAGTWHQFPSQSEGPTATNK